MKSDILDVLKTAGVSIEGVEDGMSLRRYGLDSVNLIQVIVEIENRYKIEFPLDEFYQNDFDTVQGLIFLIRKARGENE